MESWLILMGVLLPLAPLLQVAERRLAAPARRRRSAAAAANRS